MASVIYGQVYGRLSPVRIDLISGNRSVLCVTPAFLVQIIIEAVLEIIPVADMVQQRLRDISDRQQSCVICRLCLLDSCLP